MGGGLVGKARQNPVEVAQGKLMILLKHVEEPWFKPSCVESCRPAAAAYVAFAAGIAGWHIFTEIFQHGGHAAVVVVVGKRFHSLYALLGFLLAQLVDFAWKSQP